MSDLHIEMERWRLAVPGWAAFLARHNAAPRHPSRGPLLEGLRDIDLIVFAGDIHNGLRGIVYAEQVASYLDAPAVYVAGNHEFYHQDFALLLPAMANAAPHSHGAVTFLENSTASFIIRGQKLNVLGATLWTDFTLHGNAEAGMIDAARYMNDYVYIENDGQPLRPVDTRARHQHSRAWLHETFGALARNEPGACNIIVTHHAPSPHVLGNRSGSIAPCYASEMLLEFAHYRPAAWIHGHTHYRHDSIEHGIRLVSAPRGYVIHGGEALSYRPGVLEI